MKLDLGRRSIVEWAEAAPRNARLSRAWLVHVAIAMTVAGCTCTEERSKSTQLSSMPIERSSGIELVLVAHVSSPFYVSRMACRKTGATRPKLPCVRELGGAVVVGSQP